MFAIFSAWALYFLGVSINSKLPWLNCNNTWNTEFCWESMTIGENVTSIATNESKLNKNSPADEYFQ